MDDFEDVAPPKPQDHFEDVPQMKVGGKPKVFKYLDEYGETVEVPLKEEPEKATSLRRRLSKIPFLGHVTEAMYELEGKTAEDRVKAGTATDMDLYSIKKAADYQKTMAERGAMEKYLVDPALHAPAAVAEWTTGTRLLGPLTRPLANIQNPLLRIGSQIGVGGAGRTLIDIPSMLQDVAAGEAQGQTTGEALAKGAARRFVSNTAFEAAHPFEKLLGGSVAKGTASGMAAAQAAEEITHRIGLSPQASAAFRTATGDIEAAKELAGQAAVFGGIGLAGKAVQPREVKPVEVPPESAKAVETPTLPVAETTPTVEPTPPPTPTPAREIPKSIQELLAHPDLTAGQKMVLEKRLNGMSQVDIANENRMSKEGVRRMEERALKAIGATESIFEAQQKASELAALELPNAGEVVEVGKDLLVGKTKTKGRTAEEKAADDEATAWLKAHGAESDDPALLASGPLGTRGAAFSNWLFGNRPRAKEPTVAIDKTHRLPDPQDLSEQKILASTPRGLGRVGVIGRAVDPRARAHDQVSKAIIARADLLGKGESIGNIEVAKLKGEYGDIFPVRKKEMPKSDGTGMFQAEVTPLTDGTFGFKGDIIEAELRNPGSQKITDKQRDWINKEWKPILEDSMRLQKDAEAGFFSGDEEPQLDPHYFHRPAYGAESGGTPPSSSKPGATQAMHKGRHHATEQEGQEAGVRYEPDVNNIIGKFIQQTYRVVADTRLATDPALKGRIGEPKLNEGYGPNAPAFKVKRFIPGENGEPGVLAPSSRIYPKEVAAQLAKAYGESTPSGLGIAYNISQVFKTGKLGFDFAAPMLQLATILAKHPVAWGKTFAAGVKDLATKEGAFPEYIKDKDNYRAARELAQSGSAVGNRPDFADMAGEGEWAHKVPFFGAVADRFGRATGTMFSVAKIELWKALTHDAPTQAGLLRRSKYGQEDFAALSETIDNMLGVGRVKTIGVSDQARILENLATLGPSYYRGYFNLLSQLGQRGVGREQAIKTLASYTGAMTATTVLAMLAAGMSWDDIEKRMIPGNRDFMMVDVPLPDGTVQKIGFGGLHLATINTIGKLWNDDWKEGENPVGKFLHNRQGLIFSIKDNLIDQEDNFGRKQSYPQAIQNLLLPTTAQSLIGPNQGSASQRSFGALSDFLGIKSYPKDVKRYKPPKQQHPGLLLLNE